MIISDLGIPIVWEEARIGTQSQETAVKVLMFIVKREQLKLFVQITELREIGLSY